jgi:hypothetical protein
VFLPVALVVLADVAVQRRDPGPAVAAAVIWLLSVFSPIWLTPPSVTGVPAILGRDTFTLILIVLVLALPLRRAGPAAPVAAGTALAQPSSPVM